MTIKYSKFLVTCYDFLGIDSGISALIFQQKIFNFHGKILMLEMIFLSFTCTWSSIEFCAKLSCEGSTVLVLQHAWLTNLVWPIDLSWNHLYTIELCSHNVNTSIISQKCTLNSPNQAKNQHFPALFGRMSWTGPSNTVELFHGSPFFKVFYNFLSTSTMPSTLTLVSICSLISFLWNKKVPGH